MKDGYWDFLIDKRKEVCELFGITDYDYFVNTNTGGEILKLNNTYIEAELSFAKLILDDGWIRPPCKVGDKVYVMCKTRRAFRKAEVKAIYYTEDKKYYPKSHIIIQYDLARGRVRLNFTDFGKTVFLTRAEAEKALKGAENEGSKIYVME